MIEIMRYKIPENWIKYNISEIVNELIEAKVQIETIKHLPYQKDWIENLQRIELKREVAGTSRIEGADFTDNELDEALKESPQELFSRSQKQAHAAVQTYRWIATLPTDIPINENLIFDIHRRIVKGADDDHCEPGKLRSESQNVNFGQPRHRGASGGEECQKAFYQFVNALNHEFKGHDPIIQAFAAHYHIAAIHPFYDGNGRTARALEALLLQRLGLHNICFIPMSNFYYEEKIQYLNSLNKVREINYDLTPFIKFALVGLSKQIKRINREIKTNVAKGIFRNTMYDLFNRLLSPRIRVIAVRQLELLKILLEKDEIEFSALINELKDNYKKLKSIKKALFRDLNGLINLGAISYFTDSEKKIWFKINLDWPSKISETEFLKKIKNLPKSKSTKFL